MAGHPWDPHRLPVVEYHPPVFTEREDGGMAMETLIRVLLKRQAEEVEDRCARGLIALGWMPPPDSRWARRP